MAKPKLTREDCADLRQMYADTTRNVGVSNLAHLFKVTAATIHHVLNNNYTPLEDYEVKLAERRGAQPAPDHSGGPVIDLTNVSDEDLNREYWRRISLRRDPSKHRFGRPKMLKPCPGCGEMFGFNEMREHKPRCQGGACSQFTLTNGGSTRCDYSPQRGVDGFHGTRYTCDTCGASVCPRHRRAHTKEAARAH